MTKFALILSLSFATATHARSAGHGDSTPPGLDGWAPPAIVIPKDQAACYDRLKSELAKKVVRLKRDAFVYHWMANRGTSKYPKLDPDRGGFADSGRKILEGKVARFWDDKEEAGGSAGEGLYAATDPIATQDYCGAPDSGIVAKIPLKKGQRFLAFNIQKDMNFDVQSDCPGRGSFNYSYPHAYNPLYQKAIKELGISGIVYRYINQPYDENGYSRNCSVRKPKKVKAEQSPSPPPVSQTSSHDTKFNARAVAVVLLDAAQVGSSETKIFSREKIIQDAPIKRSDPPEMLYYKYSNFSREDWSQLKPIDSKIFSKFREWADQNIITGHNLDEFLE